MTRTVESIANDVRAMFEKVAGSEDPATSEREREVARTYLGAFNSALARSKRIAARLTRRSLRAHIMTGFTMFNPTMGEWSDRRQREGDAFIKETMEQLFIAEELRDAALKIVNRDA